MSSSRLRPLAMSALAAGAAASLAFMLHAGRTASWFLIFAFASWILSPFVLLAAADAASARWPPRTRTALHWTMLLVAAASVAIYAAADLGPLKRKTPVFVVVAPASWMLAAVALSIAALGSRRVD
jgi:hypothetical protein